MFSGLEPLTQDQTSSCVCMNCRSLEVEAETDIECISVADVANSKCHQ